MSVHGNASMSDAPIQASTSQTPAETAVTGSYSRSRTRELSDADRALLNSYGWGDIPLERVIEIPFLVHRLSSKDEATRLRVKAKIERLVQRWRRIQAPRAQHRRSNQTPQQPLVQNHSPTLFIGNPPRSVRLLQPRTSGLPTASSAFAHPSQDVPSSQQPQSPDHPASPFFGHQHQSAQYSMQYPYNRTDNQLPTNSDPYAANFTQQPKRDESYGNWGFE